jgi:hypothetical protein
MDKRIQGNDRAAGRQAGTVPRPWGRLRAAPRPYGGAAQDLAGFAHREPDGPYPLPPLAGLA